MAAVNISFHNTCTNMDLSHSYHPPRQPGRDHVTTTVKAATSCSVTVITTKAIPRMPDNICSQRVNAAWQSQASDHWEQLFSTINRLSMTSLPPWTVVLSARCQYHSPISISILAMVLQILAWRPVVSASTAATWSRRRLGWIEEKLPSSSRECACFLAAFIIL